MSINTLSFRKLHISDKRISNKMQVIFFLLITSRTIIYKLEKTERVVKNGQSRDREHWAIATEQRQTTKREKPKTMSYTDPTR